MALPEVVGALSRSDAYAFARAFVGLPWQHVPVTVLAQTLLTQHDPNTPSGLKLLRQVLGPELVRQVLAEDPNAELPNTTTLPVNTIPELPGITQLSPSQMQEAAQVGRWLDDYLAWASGAANETPLLFHQGAGLFLAAVAVGRRLHVHTPWRQQVFPNLYLMVVAVSTYYRKSAGLHLGTELARQSMPHMLLPQPGSPENFMNMLGGVLPPNFGEIPQSDQARLTKGNTFAAQRGILRDELSALFKSMARDYMSGMKELIMQLYDCPPYLDSNTNQRGLIVIRSTALSILGAATPAELASALTTNDWYNGNLARFALLTPEPNYAERKPTRDNHQAEALAARLQVLHEKLPAPPTAQALGDTPSDESWSLVAPIWDECRAYEQALRRLTAPNSLLDDRLRAVYGRLHVQALKVAILLAALDWADQGGQGRPEVQPPHWFRAQQIAETWRASAHRLLHDLGESEELRLEMRVLRLLAANPDGLTARSIYRTLKTLRKPVIDALTALELDGRVQKIPISAEGRPGPRPDVYRVLE